MSLEIKQPSELSESLREAFVRLMPQLSPRLVDVDPAQLQRVIEAPTTALFSAELDGQIVGLLTLAWYDVPSGRKAWIEDVVVDSAARGCGAGQALVGAAQQHAAQIGACKVMLTSSEARTAARALYRKMGFEAVQTTVFACNTEK